MISSSTDYNYSDGTTSSFKAFASVTTITAVRRFKEVFAINLSVVNKSLKKLSRALSKEEAIILTLLAENAKASQWILLAGLKLKLIAPKILPYIKTRFNRRMIRCNRKGMGLRIKKCLA